MMFYRRQTGQGQKYGNKKVKEDGYTFDSGVEYQQYVVLKTRQAAGEIFNLTVKPRFALVVNRVKIMERVFRPDFAYRTSPWGDPTAPMTELGQILEAAADREEFISGLWVLDCKGYMDSSDAATRIFEVMRRLTLALYGVEIRIVQTEQARRRQESRRRNKLNERALIRRAMKESI